MRRALRAWGPVLACVAAIGVATTVYVPDVGLGRTRFPWDKTAHFVMYLALGWTAARAMWVSGRRSTRAVLLAFLAGLAFAALDEWHQTLLPWREASFADWLADAAGLSAGLVLYLWPRRGRRTEIGVPSRRLDAARESAAGRETRGRGVM